MVFQGDFPMKNKKSAARSSMSLELSSNYSNKPRAGESLSPQEPASNVGQSQIQHPGRQSSLQCSPPMFQIRAKDSNSTPVAEENWNMFNNTLILTFEGLMQLGQEIQLQYNFIVFVITAARENKSKPILLTAGRFKPIRVEQSFWMELLRNKRNYWQRVMAKTFMKTKKTETKI